MIRKESVSNKNIGARVGGSTWDAVCKASKKRAKRMAKAKKNAGR